MLTTADTVHLNPDFEYRIKRLVNDYAGYSKDELIHSFEKISKRLGGLRTQTAVDAVRDGEFEVAVCIGLEYYDKTYQHAIDSRSGRKVVVDVGSDKPDVTAKRLKEMYYNKQL